jgi:hypothetical protein
LPWQLFTKGSFGKEFSRLENKQFHGRRCWRFVPSNDYAGVNSR